MTDRDVLLELKGLKTYFFLDEGVIKAVEGVDLTIRQGETLCVVGESGCGKSVTALSITQLVEKPGRIVAGEILFHRRRSNGNQNHVEVLNLAAMKAKSRAMERIRGEEISMIFQEPMTSLSPIHTIGSQIMESIRFHRGATKQEARARTIQLLDRVGIPNPELHIDDYPFQLSGGMRQRAMIAMALACDPSLLIADEPTTALDVTTQAQILDLMRELQQDFGMAMMFITHNLGVVAELADNVVVMYLGQVVEQGDVVSIFHDLRHPYTQALLRSIPKIGPKSRKRLDAIEGMVPDSYTRPKGCPFHPRCIHFMPGHCDEIVPPPISLGENRVVRCLLYQDQAVPRSGMPDERED
jgi:peptide/nickel transport system ATP-binding protein